MTIDVNGRAVDIDARPSDALAIAVRLKSPIYANPALLKKMRDPEAPRPPDAPPEPRRARPPKRATT